MAGTRLADWLEWKRKCALARCSARVREALTAFVSRRFTAGLGRFAARLAAPEPADAWHRFETHLALATTRAGKQYKRWLLDRAETAGGEALPAVEAGASLILKSVALEYLRQETPDRDTASLDQPLCDGWGHPLTLADLLPSPLPDPAHAAARREAFERGEALAARELERMTRRERVALAAKALGVPLAHPAVCAAAGCGKSQAHAILQQWLLCLGEAVRRDRGAVGDEVAARELALAALSRLEDDCLRWAKSEKNCANLFIAVEE
jgi:hypothetical protein